RSLAARRDSGHQRRGRRRRLDHHQVADPRRRLPAADRREPRRLTLFRKGEMHAMIAVITTPPRTPQAVRRPSSSGSALVAFATLARRRLALSAHTPREILVPLLTPILFADVIAPALAKSTGAIGGIDYLSFVAVGTIGLLVP